MEQSVEQLMARRGAEGVMVLNRDGLIVHSTFTDNDKKAETAESLDSIVKAASSCVKAFFGDAGEHLSFIRIKASNRELLINIDGDFVFVLVHNPKLA